VCILVYKLRPKIDLSRKFLGELFDRHFFYPMASSVLAASLLLVDKAFAARLPYWGVAALGYGQKIKSYLICVIFGVLILMYFLFFKFLFMFLIRLQLRLFTACKKVSI